VEVEVELVDRLDAAGDGRSGPSAVRAVAPCHDEGGGGVAGTASDDLSRGMTHVVVFSGSEG